MNKVIRIGKCQYGNIFARIEYSKDGRLSITGVIGPTRDGNACGSSGQFIMSFKEYDERGHMSLADITPAPGWTPGLVRQFFDAWDRWHLNDTRAGSQVQEDYLRAHPIPQSEYTYPKSHYEVASAKLRAAGLNPDADGYRYGTAWKREDVPAAVIEFLQSLPDADVTPAWV